MNGPKRNSPTVAPCPYESFAKHGIGAERRRGREHEDDAETVGAHSPHHRQARDGGRVEQLDPGDAAHPDLLPPRVLARAFDQAPAGLFCGRVAGDDGADLGQSERPRGGRRRLAHRIRSAHLFHHAGGEHGLGARLDAPVQLGPVDLQADDARRVAVGGRPELVVTAGMQRLPQLGQLQRPHHPATVVAVDARGRRRVGFLEAGVGGIGIGVVLAADASRANRPAAAAAAPARRAPPAGRGRCRRPRHLAVGHDVVDDGVRGRGVARHVASSVSGQTPTRWCGTCARLGRRTAGSTAPAGPRRAASRRPTRSRRPAARPARGPPCSSRTPWRRRPNDFTPATATCAVPRQGSLQPLRGGGGGRRGGRDRAVSHRRGGLSPHEGALGEPAA